MRRVLLILALALVAGPARADATRDALAELAKCADIADSTLRLKCFDDAVPRAKSALAAPPVPETATKSFLDWFGFSRSQPVTKPEEFGKPAPELGGEISEISSSVVEFAKTPRGKAVFILEIGQVWRQLDGDTTVVAEPQPGKTMKVLIERGVLESYNLTIDGRIGIIKVRRLK